MTTIINQEKTGVFTNERSAFWPGRKVCIVGTSLTEHNNRGSLEVVGAWARAPFTWARVLSDTDIVHDVWYDASDENGRYFTGANHGKASDSLLMIIARLPALLAMRPDVTVVEGGTNDISSQSYTDIIARLEYIYKALLNIGSQVIVYSIPARWTTSWASGSEARKKANRVNQWSKNFAKVNKGCWYFDSNINWVDPTDADGSPITARTSDGTHKNILGGYYEGKELGRLLSAVLPPKQSAIIGQDDDYDATYNEFGNLHPNPMMQGTGGANGTGSSGSVATSMRVERTSGSACTVVNSKETRAAGGDWQVMTFTPSGSAVETFYFRTSTANLTHTFAAGTWVVFELDVDVGAYSGYKSIRLMCEDQGTGGVESWDLDEYTLSSTLQAYPSEAWSGKLRTCPIQIVSGSTAVRNRLEVKIDGAVAGTPVVKGGSASFRQIPDPRVIWGLA